MKYYDKQTQTWKDIQVKVANAIENEYGESNNDGYSQNYLNEHIINVSDEVNEDYRVHFIKGKNLLPNLSASGTTNGVSWAIEGNKLTLNGTANADSTIYLYGSWGNEIALSTLKAGTYNFNVSGSTAYNKLALWLISRASSTTSYLAQLQRANENGNISFTLNNKKPITGVYISFPNGTTFTNDVYYLQVNEGSTALPYEPYITPSINVDGEEIYSKASNTYSTYEINTGKKWINGKLIYRKVVQFNPSTSAMETKTAHNISNLSEILPTSSCMLHRINNQFVPFSMFYPNTNQYLDWSIGWQVDKTHIFTWLGSSMRGQIDTTNYGAVAILEYTKTTD